jgi:hypothetical protein
LAARIGRAGHVALGSGQVRLPPRSQPAYPGITRSRLTRPGDPRLDGAVGDLAVRDRAPAIGLDCRDPSCRLPRREGAGSGPGGRDRLGNHPPIRCRGTGGKMLLVSGRAVRAECRQHLRDGKARRRAVARRVPSPGSAGRGGGAGTVVTTAQWRRGTIGGYGSSARGRQDRHHLGRQPQGRHAGGRRPTWRARPGCRAAT